MRVSVIYFLDCNSLIFISKQAGQRQEEESKGTMFGNFSHQQGSSPLVMHSNSVLHAGQIFIFLVRIKNK